jgi:stage II sporulation protein AA (anti-sigma F factor antagonist)
MATPASIEAIEAAGPVPRVRIVGEIDMDNADDAIDRLLELLPFDAPGMVVDLAGLTYVDSAGIRVFVELADRLARNGQDLALAVPSEAPINRVLSLVRLELVVPLYEDAEAAVEAITLRVDDR